MHRPHSDRAVSETLGFVLIFAVVAISIGALFTSGVVSIDQYQTQTKVANAEQAMLVFSQSVADVSRRGAPSRAVEIKLSETSLALTGTTKVQVAVDGSRVYPRTGVTPNYNATRSFVYSTEAGTLAYEWGALLRVERNGAIMVREPPFVFTSDRVLLTSIRFEGRSAVGSSGSAVLAVLERRNSSYKHYASGGSRTVTIEIRTTPRRAGAWKRYFGEQGLSAVDGDASDGVVVYEYSTAEVVLREVVIRGHIES